MDNINSYYTGRFDLGAYISRGFSIFKKQPGQFIVFCLVFGMISIVSSLIPFVSIFINPHLQAGFQIAADRVDKNEGLEIGNFFDGFKKYGDILLASILPILVFTVLAFIFLGPVIVQLFLGNREAIQDMFFNGSFMLIVLFILIVMVLGASLIYTNCFILFKDYKAIDALKASIQLFMKKPLHNIGFLLVWMFIIILSALPLLLGMFVTIPSFSASIYAAWKDQIGFEDETAKNDILDQLV